MPVLSLRRKLPGSAAARVALCIVGLALDVLVGPTAVADGLPATGHFSASTSGYLGCVERADATELYCLVVNGRPDTPATLDVRAVVVQDRAPWFVKRIVSTTAPLNAMTVTGSEAHTVISLAVSIPTLGAVQLTIYTEGPILKGGQNDTCPIYPLHYEAQSAGLQMHPVWRVTGQVAEMPVIEYGPTCTAAFTGSTSATWRVVGAA